MRGEGDGKIAAPVRVGRARASQSEDRACGQPLQITRVERRIRGDDDHAGAVGVLTVAARTLKGGQLTPDRDARNGEPSTEVRLHEHAYRPGVVLLLYDA